MAKRLGVNSRKKNAARKMKVRGAAKKVAFRSVIVALIAGAGILICFGGLKGSKILVKSFQDSSAFDIKGISIQGNNHVDSKSILEKCSFDSSKKTYSIKESSVRSALLTNPWIENVKVFKKLGGKIVVSITERKPIALVNMKSVYYLDKNGMLFPIAKKVISEMPVLSGLKDTIDANGFHQIRSADMARVKTFFHKVAEIDENFLQSITQIDFTDREKIKLSFQAYSTIVELGQANLDMGLRHLKRLETLMQNESVMPQKINLSYQNIAFVTVNEVVEQKEPVQTVAN